MKMNSKDSFKSLKKLKIDKKFIIYLASMKLRRMD